jgi:hypothetical protein
VQNLRTRADGSAGCFTSIKLNARAWLREHFMDFALAKIELYRRDLVALATELPPIQRSVAPSPKELVKPEPKSEPKSELMSPAT